MDDDKVFVDMYLFSVVELQTLDTALGSDSEIINISGTWDCLREPLTRFVEPVSKWNILNDHCKAKRR